MGIRLTQHKGFTLVELTIVIAVIGILATIVFISYGDWRHHTADSVVRNDVVQASSALASYVNTQNNYPPNLAGLDFAPSQDVALTLYTNAPSIGVYGGLSSDQNAQLFLNTCNANLNGLDNTACTFAGNGGGAKIHVKGTNTTNTYWPNPVTPSEMSLPYGPAYDAAVSAIESQFQAQGGAFPVNVDGNTVPLPSPTLQPNGPATDFCLEGRSGNYPDIIYHILPHENAPDSGACPTNPSLHYFP